MSAPRRPLIGLALGSGAARSWAHIGVIRALEQAGIRPDLVCGTSIGALVGGAYAAGEFERLEQWALGMAFKDVIAFLDVSLAQSSCAQPSSTLNAMTTNHEQHPNRNDGHPP